MQLRVISKRRKTTEWCICFDNITFFFCSQSILVSKVVNIFKQIELTVNIAPIPDILCDKIYQTHNPHFSFGFRRNFNTAVDFIATFPNTTKKVLRYITTMIVFDMWMGDRRDWASGSDITGQHQQFAAVNWRIFILRRECFDNSSLWLVVYNTPRRLWNSLFYAAFCAVFFSYYYCCKSADPSLKLVCSC